MVECDYGYVSSGSPPTFHSSLLSMVEEGGSSRIAKVGRCLSGFSFFSAMHSQAEEGGNLGFAVEVLWLSKSEGCMVRKSKHQSIGMSENCSSGAKGQLENSKNPIQAESCMTEGFPSFLCPGGERPLSLQNNEGG